MNYQSCKQVNQRRGYTKNHHNHKLQTSKALLEGHVQSTSLSTSSASRQKGLFT